MLDTRTKIRTLDALLDELAGAPWTLAAGRFPALTAEHAAALAAAAVAGPGPLVVQLAADAWGGPYPLDERSRAQLVAAVAAVDRVVICDHPTAERLRELGRPAAEIDIEARIERDIVADVLARHSDLPA